MTPTPIPNRSTRKPPGWSPSAAEALAQSAPAARSGKVALAFRRAGPRSVLDHLYQAAPCRALFPLTEAGEPPQAVLVNTSGGVVGGDHLATEIALGPEARACVTTQAAEKLYRSLGAEARIENRLSLAPGAYLEWLPQETILFDGARLHRSLEIDLAGDARLLAAETVLFGRQARGETLTYGLLHDSWRLRLDGRLAWAETTRLDGDLAALRQRPFGFGDAAGSGLLVVAGSGAGAYLALARVLAEEAGIPAGATLVNGTLLLRFVAADARALRQAVAKAAMALRGAVAGLPPRLPRAWSI